MKITFLGAVEEVTGSRFLIEDKDIKILVDCGFFQGKESERNQGPFPVDPSSIEAVILTHAHIDHSGYIPALIKNGFTGTIYCSKSTYALCSILLVDSGFLQQEAAAKFNKKKKPNQEAMVPLYTQDEAERALHFFQTVEYNTEVSIGTLTFKLIQSGHILGASFVILSDDKETLTFSGDLGRPHQLLMKAPPYLKQTDYLVLESTYGDRLHGTGDPIEALGKVVQKTVAKGGMLIIPVFAVGRAQAILYCLYQLKQQKAIPDSIPVFLDSPMAIRVNTLYCRFQDEHKLSLDLCNKMFDSVTYTPTVQESKAIDRAQPPAIIVAGSGMADGGRASYHFKYFIADKKNTIVFVGYQAEGTLGRELIDGEKKVKIYGKWYKVRADIKMIDLFSAHADYNEVLQWLSHFEQPPKKTFLTHGELKSAQSLKKKIEKRFGWQVIIPTYSESFDLD